MPHLRGQAQGLERQHLVVRPEDHAQVGRVGPETPRGDLRQGVGALGVAKEQLLQPSVAVEALDGFRRDGEIGDERPVVTVAFEGEQPPLDVLGFQGGRAAQRDEAMLAHPAGVRLLGLRHVPRGVLARVALCPGGRRGLSPPGRVGN